MYSWDIEQRLGEGSLVIKHEGAFQLLRLNGRPCYEKMGSGGLYTAAAIQRLINSGSE